MVTALERLREHYEFERRGFVVRELAGGYTLTSHPDAEPAARRLLAKPRTPPLTAAQAETLAIVAYLQPVSRPEIARIRGVSAESAAATLLERGIIEEAGRSQFGAVLYRTTELFLKLFGLDARSASCPRSRASIPRPSSSRSCASACCAPARRAAASVMRARRSLSAVLPTATTSCASVGAPAPPICERVAAASASRASAAVDRVRRRRVPPASRAAGSARGRV